jgi:hypothetical protein
MDDNEQRQAPEEFEREFFGPNQVGEIGTAELDRIAESQATRILKPIVFALLLGLSGLTAWQYVGHLRYFFAPVELAPLGAAEDIGAAIRAGNLDPNLRSHRLVSLSGIPQRYASAGDKGVFKLIGAQLYVARTTPKKTAKSSTAVAGSSPSPTSRADTRASATSTPKTTGSPSAATTPLPSLQPTSRPSASAQASLTASRATFSSKERPPATSGPTWPD